MVYTSKYPSKEYLSDVSMYDIMFNNDQNVPQDKLIYVNIENTNKFLTYGQVRRQVLKCAAGLKREFDLNYGDVVAVCSPNDVDYPIVLHGTVCAGGVLAAIDQNVSPDKIALDLELVQAKILITHKDKIDDALAAAKIVGIPTSNVLVFGDVDTKGARAVDHTILSGEELATPYNYTPQQIMGDPAYLYFTSGTSSGKKKAVMVTQRTIIICMLMNNWPSTGIKFLAYTEFHHGSALATAMHFSIYYGYTTYVMPHYTLRKFCEAVQNYKIVLTATQPYIISALVKNSIAREYDLSSLKCVLSCGAAVSAFENLGLEILNVYGMTEIIGVLKTTPETSLANSIGYLAPGYTAKLVNEEGNEVPTDEVGELWVKGPTVTPGYYRDPEATAEAIDVEGYLHTGDLLKCDAKGLFFYVDRSKDLIKYYLAHIYPSEIENVLLAHPKVADCAVIGVYSPEFVTELPRAYVHLFDGERHGEEVQQELQEYADSRLPDKKRLRGGIVIVDSFPRTASGKIQRRVLRQNAHAETLLY